jgi:hypothetical protein
MFGLRQVHTTEVVGNIHAVDDILAADIFEWCISKTQGGTDCDVAPMTASPPNLRDSPSSAPAG